MSYDSINTLLTDSDSRIISLKSKTDLELLNLNGQTNLKIDTINAILENNKSTLKYLGLKDLVQITNFSYAPDNENNE